jgi:hypothetical protein
MSYALLLLLCHGLAWADDISWQVSSDSSAWVGSELNVRYRAQMAPGLTLEPDVLSSATTDFLVLKTAALSDGTWQWTLLPLGEGNLSFTSRWRLNNNAIVAPAVSLAVKTPGITPESEITDIKEPLAARRALWPWLLCAVLGALGWEAWKRWKNRPVADNGALTPQTPALAVEVQAENALRELLRSGLWEQALYADFYLRLTDILRDYLEARYQEPATAMTSQEVSRLVKSKTSDLTTATSVREILSRADLVKFARIKPQENEGTRDVETVRAIIAATTPIVADATSSP